MTRVLSTLSICLILLAIVVGGSSQSGTASATDRASSRFQRPAGIYAIGLAAQSAGTATGRAMVPGDTTASVNASATTVHTATVADNSQTEEHRRDRPRRRRSDSTPTIPGNPLPSATPANGTFTLIWTPSTDADGVASYELQRSSNRGLHFTTIAMPATNSHTETNLASGKYQYRVRAVDTLGNKSPYSRTAMRGVYSLDSGGGAHRDANIRSHSYVEGYVLRPSWSELESARDVYDFRMIDHVVAKLEPIGKKLSLEIMRPPEPGYIARTPGVTTWEDKDTRYDDDRDPSTPLYRAVPWDPFLLERFERLMKALSDHLLPDASQSGKLVPLRDHPALANLNPALPGTHAAIRNPVPPNSIRVADMPGYTRDAFKDAVLRDLHAAVDNFPNQYVYEGFWDVRDNTASPLLWQAIRDLILTEFDGVKNPRVGFFQENLATSKDPATGVVTGIPNPQVAQALSASRDSTYIAFQALQGWRNPFNDPAKTANTTPADAMKFAYDNYGATYFEIYVGDLDFAGYAAGFTEWNDRFVDLSAVAVSASTTPNVTSASAASFSSGPTGGSSCADIVDYVDPRYDRTIRQLLKGNGHEHNIDAHRNPWNADSSLMIGVRSDLQEQNWKVALYDGNGCFVKELFGIGEFDWRLVWDRNDPDLLYTRRGGSLYRYNVVTGQAELLRSFEPLGLGPNGPSLNQAGDRILVVTSDRTFRSYSLPDMQDERTFRVSHPPNCSTDWEDERYTGYGNTIVTGCASSDLGTQAILVYDDTGLLVHHFDGIGGGGHWDFSPDGRLAYVRRVTGGRGSGGAGPLEIHVVNLDGTGDRVLYSASASEARSVQNLHVSWPDRVSDWFVASLLPNAQKVPSVYSPPLDEIMMIRTDGTVRILARAETVHSPMFWAQPLASPSADGTRISFNSNQMGTIDQHILFVAVPQPARSQRR